jgi:hypothetical protein
MEPLAPVRSLQRSRWTVSALLVAAVAIAYGLPFVGVWLSLALPVGLHLGRRALWGPAAPPRASLAVLTWLGLWLLALGYVLTGWWGLSEVGMSTAWLLLPLCGPDSTVGLVVPALVATAVFAAGLVASVLRRQPWLVVAGAWLAPWAHQLALAATATEMIC